MNHAVQSGFDGDFEVLLENLRLPLLVACVVVGSAAGLSARQMVIVQTRFTDGNDFRMLHQFAQRFANIVRCCMGV